MQALIINYVGIEYILLFVETGFLKLVTETSDSY